MIHRPRRVWIFSWWPNRQGDLSENFTLVGRLITDLFDIFIFSGLVQDVHKQSRPLMGVENNTMRRILLGTVFLTGFAMQANAGCTFADVKLTIASTVYTPTACAINVAQNAGPLVETANLNAALGVNFSLLDTSGVAGAGTPFQGIAFTVTAGTGTTGAWTMGWTDTNGSAAQNLPLYMDFVVGLFGGDHGDGYFFNHVLLPVTPISGSGTYAVTFLNNAGNIPGLSHLILDGGNPTPAPEPASIALFGAGLLGLGMLNRRKQNIN